MSDENQIWQTLEDVVAELKRRGVPASFEYPGFIACSTNSALSIHAGFVNGPFGVDLVDFDGNVLNEGFESDIPEDCQDVARIADHICACLTQTNEAVSRW